MPGPTPADTIRILVASDNHVGYGERDPIRGDDSWKAFDEILQIGQKRDVDMVLLGGDLFHENKPSRKSLYNVMRSIRMYSFGDRPCELEMLSEPNDNFTGSFNHANYEDPDINVSIPIFSIHGNHDDPSGQGHLAALDILEVAGLINYYGRIPEADKVNVKPILLQKGRTKLALFGMSNIRDERMQKTFREENVKFFRPETQQKDWFNILTVHQNHHAYTETGYLPEHYIPDFMDLVVWGHEHECLIDPRLNHEFQFHVMQPGSSVATSLCPGEAVPKHVAIVTVTGKEFKTETIRLKTVRPFLMKEIVLSEIPELRPLSKKENHRPELTEYLVAEVEELIQQAKREWEAVRAANPPDEGDIELDEDKVCPLPLIRLRVEHTAPDGGKFDCENAQRFSNRFVGKVANISDVVQFHRKKARQTRTKEKADMPDEAILAAMQISTVKVDKLVREFLAAQNLVILPQNTFGDAVAQFVDKDDKHAMELFVNESLDDQMKHLMDNERPVIDEKEMQKIMDDYRLKLEQMFNKGVRKKPGQRRYKPKPDNWDSDVDGDWEAQPGALLRDEEEEAGEDGNGVEDDEEGNPRAAAGRTTKKATGARGSTTKTTKAATAKTTNAKKAPAARSAAAARRKQAAQEDDDDNSDDNDVQMPDLEPNVISDDDDEASEEIEEVRAPPKAASRSTRAAATKILPTPTKKVAAPATTRVRAPAKKAVAATAAKGSTGLGGAARQSQLSFSQTPAAPASRAAAAASRRQAARSVGEEDDDDDDDAFEPIARGTRKR